MPSSSTQYRSQGSTLILTLLSLFLQRRLQRSSSTIVSTSLDVADSDCVKEQRCNDIPNVKCATLVRWTAPYMYYHFCKNYLLCGQDHTCSWITQLFIRLFVTMPIWPHKKKVVDCVLVIKAIGKTTSVDMHTRTDRAHQAAPYWIG